MLKVSNIVTGYNSSLAVLGGVSFDVKEGEIVAILGSNGAGKSTTLRTVAGLMRPWEGSVVFSGEDISGVPAHEVVRKGLSLVPEGRLLFGKLTVHENLTMGAFTRKDRAEIQDSLDMVYTLFPRVKERMHQKANTLSGGEQQMVAIARGLMSKPRLLILDEPSLGLAPKLVKEVFAFVKEINRKGISVLIVEQNVKETLLLSDRAFIIQDGKTTFDGRSEELMDDDNVRKAYLGM
ncbi:MAG: ABC transporter ATP-binding protein [Lachnospiraceae bacterium]|nr:ABC transporter ATP-binding protein [Lachnospiraceae bacterium]